MYSNDINSFIHQDDDEMREVGPLPLDLEWVFLANKFKDLDQIQTHQESDLNMINYVLDAHTWCFENYARQGDIRWVNTKTRVTKDLDPNVVKDNFLTFFACKSEQVVGRLRKKRRYASFIYNPYTTEIEFMKDGMRCFNTYDPPMWKLKTYPAVLPAQLDKFMKHLFPKEDSREYVYDWLANGLKNRNLTYLFLLSTQGAGKGIFSNIVMSLYGKSNFTKAGQTFINKEFNAYVKDKQVVVFNEITAKESEGQDKLKGLVDDTIMIEGKSRDAFEHNNHLNVIITINRPDAIQIEDNDRRYSIVHLNPTPLKDAFTSDEVTAFSEMYKDEELVGQMGQWLIERKIKRNMLHKFTDEEKLHEIDNVFMYKWQQFVVDEVCEHKTGLGNTFTSIQLNDALSEAGYQKVGWNKLDRFIKERCGDVLRTRRNKMNPSILDIEFINPKKNNKDGIPF